MDKTTFQDPYVTQFINKNYIAVKFNAEQKEDVNFKGEIYSYTRGGRRGYHTLAAKITNGQLRYPTIVFLDEEADVIQAIPGFLDAETLEIILAYFAADYHKTTPWASYIRSYKRSGDVNNSLDSGLNNSKLVIQKN